MKDIQCSLQHKMGLPSLPTISGTVIVYEIVEHSSRRWPIQWLPCLTAPKYHAQLTQQTFSKEAQNFVQLLVWTTVQFYAQDAKPKFQFQPKPNVKYNSISTEYLEISAVEGKLHFKPRGPRHQLIFCLGNVRY